MLSAIFAAIKRLAASLNTTADLVDQTNEQLRYRLAIVDDEPTPAPIDLNGRGKKLARNLSMG